MKTNYLLNEKFFGILIVLVLFAGNILFSQNPGEENTLQTPNVFPPSPTAASLGRVADIPVSLYTGSPNISIPLGSLNGRMLTVPVSISYSSTGVKVEEIPGWVGLGWNLNAGGVITRSMRGLPDEHTGGFLEKGLEIPSPNAIEYWKFEYLKSLADGATIDTEADLFYYNFNGNSGKFIFGNNGLIYTIPYQDLVIKDSIQDGEIVGFRIIDEDGTHYIFGYSEHDLVDGIESTDLHNKYASTVSYNSSWYLAEIISSNLTDTISFSYTNHNFTQYSPVSESKEIAVEDIQNYQTGQTMSLGLTSKSYGIMDISGKKLTKISSNIERVFISNSSREDNTNLKKLDNICFYRMINGGSDSVMIREFSFNYFYPNGGYRLMLQSVRESNGTINLPPYSFHYNPIPLPPFNSKMQDHWGYYNGAYKNVNLNSMLPMMDYNGVTLDGAIRDPNPDYVMAGILEDINYPTGARKSIIYEPNKVKIWNGNNVTVESFSDIVTVVVPQSPTGCYADSCFYTIPESYVFRSGNITVSVPGREINPCIASSGTCVSLEDTITGEILWFYPQWESKIWDQNFNFEKGHVYKVRVLACCEPDIQCFIHISYDYYEENTNELYIDVITGGIRIKEIHSYDNDTLVLSKFLEYDNPNDGYSSAALFSNPVYYYYTTKVTHELAGMLLVINEDEYLVRSANSYSPLGSSNGSPVGYSFVTENRDEAGEQGKTEYMFSQFPDNGSSGYPFAPKTDMNWARGKPISKTDYRFDNVSGDYITQRSEFTEYNDFWSDDRHNYDMSGLKVGWKKTGYPLFHVFDDYNAEFFQWQYFYEYSRWMYVTASEVKEYDFNGLNPITARHEYYYDSPFHTNMTKEVITNSDGSIVKNLYKYPYDFSFNNCGDDVNILTDNYNVSLSDEKEDYENCYFTGQDSCLSNFNSCLTVQEYYSILQDFENCIEGCNNVNCKCRCHNDHDYQAKYDWCINQSGGYNNCMSNLGCYEDFNSSILSIKQGYLTAKDDYYSCFGDKIALSDEMMAAIGKMNYNHITTPLIEKQKWVKEYGENEFNLIQSVLKKYRDFGDLNIQPDSVSVLALNDPVNDFLDSNCDENNNFIADGRYEELLVFDQYDRYGQLLEYHRVNDMPISHVWGYDSTLPIANFINANIEEVQYSGFENKEGNGWSKEDLIEDVDFAHSGDMVISVTSDLYNGYGPGKMFTINNISPPITGYKASVWVKTQSPNPFLLIQIGEDYSTNVQQYASATGEWELLVVEMPADMINNNYTDHIDLKVYVKNQNTIPAYFDDFAFYPSDAQFEFYSYSPNGSPSSILDANQLASNYLYDDLGRLTTNLNDDINILQHIEYNHKGYFSAYFTYLQNYDQIDFTADNINQDYTYDWDFGDGSTGTGSTVSHTFNAVDDHFDVTLTVTDLSGNTLTHTQTIHVYIPPLSVDFQDYDDLSHNPHQCPRLIDFSAEVTSGTGDYTFDWSVTYPDGNQYNYTDDPEIHYISFASYYFDVGTTTVYLTVTDNHTGSYLEFESTKIAQNVSGNCPVASYTVTPSPAYILEDPIMVSFNADEDEVNTFYEWDFGDGLVLAGQGPDYKSPNHTYYLSGTYLTSLKVDNSAQSVLYFTVIEGEEPTDPFSVQFTPMELTGHFLDCTQQFTALAANGETPYSYEWKVKEGSSEPEIVDPGSPENTLLYTFSNTGYYKVYCTVSDNTGISFSKVWGTFHVDCD